MPSSVALLRLLARKSRPSAPGEVRDARESLPFCVVVVVVFLFYPSVFSSPAFVEHAAFASPALSVGCERARADHDGDSKVRPPPI